MTDMDEHLETVTQIKAVVIDLAIRFGPRLLAAVIILVVGAMVGRWVSRVMAGGLREEAAAVLHRPHLLVARGEIKPADAGEGNGRRAHRAGLQCYIEVATGEAFAAHKAGRGAVRQKLGMGGGVLEFQRAVAGARQDAALPIAHHGADRHLAPARGGFCFRKGGAHWLWQFPLHSAT